MAKVMVSMPDDLLERIDREARRQGETRSAFLRESALRRLGKPDPEEFERTMARMRAIGDTMGPFESGDVIRADRDERDARDRRRL